MKCVAVSDIHLRDIKTPEADLLIVAGDISMKGRASELEWFESWLNAQPQKHKVWIAGNHEMGIEEDPSLAEKLALRSKSIYLQDSGIELEGLSIWGSPITPYFFDWAFNRHRGQDIRKHWLQIPEGTDILITHGPPLGYLDLTGKGEHVGCADLLDVIENHLSYPPQVMVFGHIHSGYGQCEYKRADGKIIKLINASSCDEKYTPTNKPIVFEI
ncbi:MAG: metallophosphatase domain-containing protein [Candidatus Obscuribacterales bacterium]|nr:metallophosphatase domain-containing protein [Candidatus Obscuribacterales bacterium]